MLNFFRRIFRSHSRQTITAGRDCVAVNISGNGNTTKVSSGAKGVKSKVVINGEVVYDGKRQDAPSDRP